MDKKLKAKWVKALMSGKYEQGSQYLCKDGKFCCLGVLRDINDKKDEGHSPFKTTYVYDEGLNNRQLKKFGLRMDEQIALAKLNDDGVPFPVIAGFIQENL